MILYWIGALVAQGLLPEGERPSADAFTTALYGYLARTPALMIGVNLAEAAGETRSRSPGKRSASATGGASARTKAARSTQSCCPTLGSIDVPTSTALGFM